MAAIPPYKGTSTATTVYPIIVDKSSTASTWDNNMPYQKHLNRAERRALRFKRNKVKR